MKNILLIVFIICIPTIVTAQSFDSAHLYLSNNISFGLAIRNGSFERKSFEGSTWIIKESEKTASFGYQILGGYYLNSKVNSKNKWALESGLNFNYYYGSVLGDNNKKLKLEQTSAAIPIGLMRFNSHQNKLIKYGGGIIFQNAIFKEISGANDVDKSSVYVFRDRNIGLFLSGAYFHSLNKKNRIIGIGFNVVNDTKPIFEPTSKIPFSLKQTSFYLSLYPFLWFFD
jgi:hypothetical protein